MVVEKLSLRLIDTKGQKEAIQHSNMWLTLNEQSTNNAPIKTGRQTVGKCVRTYDYEIG